MQTRRTRIGTADVPRVVAVLGDTTLLLVLGAATLTLWLLARFPAVGPHTLGGAAGNVLAAFALGHLVGPAVRVVAEWPVPEPNVVALLVAALPPLVYLFLALAWFFRVLGRLVSAYS